MKTARRKIAAVIARRASGPVSAKRLAREIAAYLLTEGRTGERQSLMRDVIRERAGQGLVEVATTSAHPLSDKSRADTKAQVKKLYPQARKIIISETIDPRLIGGIKMEFADERLDLSVRAKLNRFKQLTTHNGDQAT